MRVFFLLVPFLALVLAFSAKEERGFPSLDMEQDSKSWCVGLYKFCETLGDSEKAGCRMLNNCNTLLRRQNLSTPTSCHSREEEDIFDLNSSFIAPDDPRVLELIRRSHLIHPSREPYRLNNPSENPTRSVQAVSDISRSKRNGFFLEIGAHDGEWASNTLELELNHGWTGILVEPNPYLFANLVAKRRKCWASNTCIFPSASPIKLRYLHHDRKAGNGKVMGPGEDHGVILEVDFMKEDHFLDEGEDVSCFPVESLLHAVALNESLVVDFISLDVVGNELAVLESIPLEKLGVKFITVGHVYRPNGKVLLTKHLEERGYSFVTESFYQLYFKRNYY